MCIGKEAIAKRERGVDLKRCRRTENPNKTEENVHIVPNSRITSVEYSSRADQRTRNEVNTVEKKSSGERT